MTKAFKLTKMCETTRFLKIVKKINLTTLRFYSSESKYGQSNLNFPKFTTKKNFKGFEKTPNVETIATIMVYGLNTSPSLHLFPEKSDTKSLLEGSLYAIEAVTKNIANSM